MSNILNTVENQFEEYWNSTEAPYPTETLAPQSCIATLEPKLNVFWDVVYSMLALFFLTLLLPYLLFCFRNRPRCMATCFNTMAFVFVVMGITLSTVLMPQCPLNCGELVCGVHKYNPGPIYGCISIFMGVLWMCKACSLQRQAKRAEVEQEAAKATVEGGEANKGTEIV